jgi:endoglucanase
MNDNQKNFLKNILNIPSPSGFEEPVQNLWNEEVSKFCPNITADPHGNLIAVLNPDREKSLMIVGHSDEIGLIVKYINDSGFIYVNSIGGVDPSILGSHRARIITKKGVIWGAIGRTSLHLERKWEKEAPKMNDIWIDIGAKNKKDALKYVSIGDPVIFGEEYVELQNDLALARCWDNRVGIYIVAEVLRQLAGVKNLKHTVYGVSSTMEETGVWAARQAAYSFRPTAAIAIDVMPSTDDPHTSKEKYGEAKVGDGTVITRGVRTNNKMSSELISIAERSKIPYQIEVDNGNTGTDADPISQVRAGIPIGVVSVATRYLHSSVEVLSLKDIQYSIDLLVAYIKKSDLDL